MVEERDEKRITVRVSPEMYESVVAAAKAKNMSINGYIIRAIENAEFDAALERRMAGIEDKIRELEAKGIKPGQ